jgi:hypothetical protein
MQLGAEVFLLSKIFKPDLMPIQPPIQWESGAIPSGAKLPEREADHIPPSSASVKN